MITFALFLLVLLLVFGSAGTSVFKKDQCRLKWSAVYHVSGHRASLQINETWIDTLGHCIAHSLNSQNYIFRLKLHVFRGDTPMKTLFRNDAKAEQCPFKVPFNFTYTTQDGSCTSRISYAIACSMHGKYRFQYQACPELPDSETHVDELECIAYWSSFGIEFFAVRIINSSITGSNTIFRCLIHQRTVFGGRMGISADSSCSELTDLTYAGTTIDYTISDPPLKPRCHFPSFLQLGHHSSDRQHWISMTAGSMHHFVEEEWVERLNEANYSVAKCLQSEDLGNVHRMLIHITKECDSGYQCLKVKRRHKNVVEITRSGLMEEAPDSCNVIDEHIIDTMVFADAEMTRCPINRQHSVAPCTSHHPTLQFGCTNEYKIQRKCDNTASSEKFFCIGHWREGEVQYIVTKDVISSKLLCCIYSPSANGASYIRSCRYTACHPRSLEQHQLHSTAKYGNCSFLNGVWRRAEIDSTAAVFLILFALIRRC